VADGVAGGGGAGRGAELGEDGGDVLADGAGTDGEQETTGLDWFHDAAFAWLALAKVMPVLGIR
jgi:hypothetical protein